MRGGSDFPRQASSGVFRYFGSVVVVLLLIAFIGSIEPGTPPRHAWRAIEVQEVHVITSALQRYAQDHQGKFPTGSSSTEVFQKLLEGENGGYLGNPPTMFYFPMKGKTPALEGQPLKPENVCFDVTSPVDLADSPDLPLVFSTGFKISYTPGASARMLVPLDFRWPGFELFRPDPGPRRNWIAVGYLQESGRLMAWPVTDATRPGGFAADFIPKDFKAHGKTYVQLTPEGPLPSN